MKVLNAREYNRGNITINETHNEELKQFFVSFVRNFLSLLAFLLSTGFRHRLL
jgi:hypothetical protein